MKLLSLLLPLFFSIPLCGQARFDVSSKGEFDAAQEAASYGDSIVWAPGTYMDTRMDIDKDGLIITALPHGTVLFSGASRSVINASNITFSGFQYIGGAIANLDVLRVYGSDVLIAQINIQNYTCFKYLVIDEDSKRTTIRQCNFENRLNLDDKNILSILVDNEPGYHKIQRCSFKNFDGIGADMGIEPIRIGVSTQGHLDSRTLVEYCYFTRCNGDGEIISHKARQNVYRYNTFENNPLSELVLRHGDEGMVYGNFFINNRGGIRIREGSHHFIFNNYFEGLDGRAIWLMNDPVDPLDSVHIYHNTVINSKELRLGGVGDYPPTNVFIANNVFANPMDELMSEETGNENFINNYSFGPLGIDLPTTGISEIDPLIVENADGFFQPDENSPVIEMSAGGFPAIPLYPGMDYDHEISLDLMKIPRPLGSNEKAIGASEFSSSVDVQPHATEMNTGPSYLFDNLVDYLTANASQLYIVKEGDTRVVKISSNLEWTVQSNEDWISIDLLMGTGDDQLVITVEPNEEIVSRSGLITVEAVNQSLSIIVYQDPGVLSNEENSLEAMYLFPNPTFNSLQIRGLPTSVRRVLIDLISSDGRVAHSKAYSSSDGSLEIDLEEILPGTYFLNLQCLDSKGEITHEFSQKILKK